MFCSQCGNKAIEGAVFCQKCGARLSVGDAGQQSDMPAIRDEAVYLQPDKLAVDHEATENLLDVTLTNAGVNVIYVIRMVRKLTGLRLKDCQKLVDNTPALLKKGVTQEEAKLIKETFMNAGATVIFTNQDGSCADIIVHCKACKAPLEDGSNTCKSCGRVFVSLSNKEADTVEVDIKDFLDSNVWEEIFEEFKKMPIARKMAIILCALASAGLAVLLLRVIFSSLILMIVAVTGGYYVYYYWGANYITKHKYLKRIRELHLPNRLSSQTLLEALSGKFNYPYFKGVRYGHNGECVIDGRYSAYAITIYDNDTAALSADFNVQDNMKRTVMLEGMAICSYLNKFFNPSSTDNVVKDIKALKSVERRRKTIGVVNTVASILIVAVFVLEYALPGSLQRITTPGAQVRGAYLTQYSETVTIEEAFHNFFTNEKWSTYESEGYSYVVFTGSCQFIGEQVDIRLTFKITGEQFRVDSLDINGQEQGDLMMYSLLSKVYEDYEEE